MKERSKPVQQPSSEAKAINILGIVAHIIFLRSDEGNNLTDVHGSDIFYDLIQFSLSVMSDSLQAHRHCSMPGFPVHHQFLELAQTHVHKVGDANQPSSSSVIPISSCLQSFPASGAFPKNQFFASGSQNIGASASASVLPMNIQD